jgi:hypothetical protein
VLTQDLDSLARALYAGAERPLDRRRVGGGLQAPDEPSVPLPVGADLAGTSAGGRRAQ